MIKDNSRSQVILLVNTTERDRTSVAVVSRPQAHYINEHIRAQDLQKMILKLLTKAHISLEQLTAIAVFIGPGSYTGTRIGVACANTLAGLLQIPIIELATIDFDTAIGRLQSDIKFKYRELAKVRY